MTDAGTANSTSGSSTPLLHVENLHTLSVNSGRGPIVDELCGLNLVVNTGEVHVLLRPRSSTGSSVGAALLGSPNHRITAGSIRFRGDDVTEWPVDERAKAGMFLAFQTPDDVEGMPLTHLLRHALSARKNHDLSVADIQTTVMDWTQRLRTNPDHSGRSRTERLSACDKIGDEFIQMAILRPQLAMLDINQFGDATDLHRIVASGIHELRAHRKSVSIVLTTDDQRLIDEVAPDHQHLLVDGRIISSGELDIAERCEHVGAEPLRTVGV